MSMRDCFSKLVNAQSFTSGPKTLTITKAEERMVGQGAEAERKPVCSFAEIADEWACNTTKTNLLCDAFGEEGSDWVGHQIILSQGYGEHKGGKKGPVIDLTIPAGTPPIPDPVTPTADPTPPANVPAADGEPAPVDSINADNIPI